MRVASPLKGTSSIKSAMSPRCHRQAYGTTDTPGKCTDKWPTGFTYKARYCSRETGWKPVHVLLWPPTTRESLQDDDNCETVNGTAHCWKCLWHAVHHSAFLQKDIYKFMYYMHYIYILYIYYIIIYIYIYTYIRIYSLFVFLVDASWIWICPVVGSPELGSEVCTATLCIWLSLCCFVLHAPVEQRRVLSVNGT